MCKSQIWRPWAALPIYIIAISALGVTEGLAGEYEHRTVDLSGSGHQDTVIMSTSGSGDFQDFTLAIREVTIHGKYFAVDGDVPELSIIRIDRATNERQLLVRADQAASCIFHVIGYVKLRLIPLLTVDQGPDCKEPQPNGNGTITVNTWQDFWNREDQYRLNANGTALTLIPQRINTVGVAGFPKSDVTLDAAGCKVRTIRRGSFTKVVEFDPAKHRFLLNDYNGACGWLGEDDLKARMEGLPWAG